MVSDVLDVSGELKSIVGGDFTRPPGRAHELAVESTRRATWRWVFLGILAVGAFELTLYLLAHPIRARSDPPEGRISLPASLYFDAPHAALGSENIEAIVTIAKVARSSPNPVVVVAFADPSGNRGENLRLAQKRAAGVRDALVMAGVPRLRVTLASPAFAATNDTRRVEIALVHGVRAFPAQRAAEVQPSLSGTDAEATPAAQRRSSQKLLR